jgi:hypothetical protein
MSEPTSPLALRAAQQNIGGWRITDLTGVLPGSLQVRLARESDGAKLWCIVGNRGAPALVQTSVGSVYYKRFEGCSEAEAVEATRALAKALDAGTLPIPLFFPHLAMSAKPTEDDRQRLARLVGSQMKLLPGAAAPSADELLPRGRDALYFDPPGIAEFLAPEVVVDGAAVSGCVLRAIYLPPVGRRQSVDFSSFVLEFVREGTDDTIRLRLSAGAGEGFGRVGDLLSLDLMGHTGEIDALPVALTSLASWLLTLLRLKAGSGLKVTVPTKADELRALNHPADRTAPSTAWSGTAAPPGTPGANTGRTSSPPALNLAIDTECHQACAFCSVKSYVKPSDGGDAEFENIRFQLRAAREQGVDEVRLNGIDPLTYSRVLDVVSTVKELGFPKLTVYSPCRRLADDTFRAEFLRRAPTDLTITVPLYGTSAETHDKVVGAPGAYAQARRALDTLLEISKQQPRLRVHVSTVLVKHNLGEFSALAAFVRERGLALHPHVPYPMRQTTQDPYALSAARESDIVGHFLADLGRHPGGEDQKWALRLLSMAVLHPCLLVGEERRRALPVFGVRDQQSKPMLPGTEYRAAGKFVHDSGGEGTASEAFAVTTVPCPQAERCALAPLCPAEHYAVYQQLFGLDEFKAVTPMELYQLRRP